jgi:FRG domain
MPLTLAKAGRSRVRRCRVSTWLQFVETVQGWAGFRNWAFRGEADARWPLQSTLTRQVRMRDIAPAAWPRQEDRIRRIFQRKSHLYLSSTPGDDLLEWLALMQDHGAPTRLLDFTWSPYVAAFFALERAGRDAAVWALNLPCLRRLHEEQDIDGVEVGRADPRDAAVFDQFYLPNTHAFVWQGDPFRMPLRVVAQSGTFLVSGHLGLTVEEILERYPGTDTLLVQFVFDTEAVRPDAMAALYSMNITQATLFPDLDGLARSMAYEFEYSWEVDLATNMPLQSLRDPRLPPDALRPSGSDRAARNPKKVPRPARPPSGRRRSVARASSRRG